MQFGTANFSRCGNYRYQLTRSVDDSHPDPSITFVMLNPAKADALKNDQTIAKCVGFAERWGMRTLNVVNLYAYRTSYQNELYAATDPVGPNNSAWLRKALCASNKVVCAWGKGVSPTKLKAFNRLINKHKIELFCLGTNLDGSPKHPARIGYAQQLQPFQLVSSDD